MAEKAAESGQSGLASLVGEGLAGRPQKGVQMSADSPSQEVAPVPGKAPGIVTAAMWLSILGICGITAIVGIILGIVGRGKAKAAGAGVGRSTAAIVIGIAWLVILPLIAIATGGGGGSGSLTEPVAEEAVSEEVVVQEEPEQPAGAILEYQVSSDAPISSVTYLTVADGSTNQQQENDLGKQSWSKTIQLPEEGFFDASLFSLVAQASENSTTISCVIRYNGEVLSQGTSSGAFSIVTCAGDTFN